MLLAPILVACAVLLWLLGPFFSGRGGSLAAAAELNDLNAVDALRKSVLKAALAAERARERGELTQNEWERRAEFLENRYCDLVQRADFLRLRSGS